jgi:WD40 repeat protein
MTKHRLLPIFTFVIVVGLLIGSAGTAAAQEPSVRFIPVVGELLLSKLSPDGHTLAVFENAQVHNGYEVVDRYLPIQLVNLDTGEVTRLEGFTDYAFDVAFSADGTRLVSVHGNGEIIVWDLATGTPLNRFWGFPGTRPISLLPDGNTLIGRTSSSVTQLGQWDLTTGYITAILQLHYASFAEVQAQWANGMPDAAINFSVGPDGQSLAVLTSYGRIWRWDLQTGEPTLLLDSEAEHPMLYILNLTFTADSATLIYLDRQSGVIHFMDAMTGAETNTLQVVARYEPAISPDGRVLVWVDKDTGMLKRWDAAQPDTVTDLMAPPVSGDLPPAPTSTLPVLFMTPDGSRLVFAGYAALGIGDNMIAVIDLPE